MKKKYICETCGKDDFKSRAECKRHEAAHGKIAELVKAHPSRYEIGDRIGTLAGTSLPAIQDKSYDVDRGWVYCLGTDQFCKPVEMAEDGIEWALQIEELKALNRDFNKRLKNISGELYAVHDAKDFEECAFYVRRDPKLPYAIKMLKAHMKDGIKTTKVLYFPDKPGIVMLEFVEGCSRKGCFGKPEAMTFSCFRPTRKIPYHVEFALLANATYKGIEDGKSKLPNGLRVNEAIDLMDFL